MALKTLLSAMLTAIGFLLLRVMKEKKCLNEKMSFVSPNDIANINEMSHHLRVFYGFLTG